MQHFLPLPKDQNLHVVVLLPTMNPYGGVISVVNICNRLIDLGHRVTIGCLSQHGSDLVHARTEPVYADSAVRLAQLLPDTADVVVATSWETVEPAILLHRRCREAALTYFVQDIESDFETGKRRTAALDTYSQITHRVVKTAHLQARLANLGHESHRVPPGMDLDMFYPRDTSPSPKPMVLAMARPDAPNDHRGWSVLKDVYERLQRTSDAALHVFGSSKIPALDATVTNHGRVAPAALPQLYSEATVVVDTSRTHGFGRTGVEAMACMTACVLSRSGGPAEYAVDGHNCLVVEVGDAPATVAAVERLIADGALRASLALNGVNTVQAYSDANATARLLELWSHELGRTRPVRAQTCS
jgi:glycosyltransferase involved in cell wall biosynthesis